MGSQVILDIIASFIVFGSLLMMTIRLNVSANESLGQFKEELIVQQNLVDITRQLEFDFRKMGYCRDYTKITSPYLSIRYADSNRIKFWTDFPTGSSTDALRGDGNLDSLTYYVGPTSELTTTDNPNDRLLYRVENNQTPIGVSLGVTTFDLKYYNAFRTELSRPVADPRQIQYLQITIQVESPFKTTMWMNTARYDTAYQSAFWRQVRLVAKNLSSR
jgi:hypothetical protein